jgi:hypothetical protein
MLFACLPGRRLNFIGDRQASLARDWDLPLADLVGWI